MKIFDKPVKTTFISNIIDVRNKCNTSLEIMNQNIPSHLTLDVLQQFRVIYGTMRQYFREVEERCGLSGSQMWILQEVQRTPELGVTELAGRLGVHQSTCSQLVEKLVARGCLIKKRPHDDHRRVGLCLTLDGLKAIAALPGPAEGILPEALAAIPEVALKTLNINLSELIRYLPGKDDSYATTPLAEMVRFQDQDGK
jgi:DNA-binding MarR family transcriptional regulator